MANNPFWLLIVLCGNVRVYFVFDLIVRNSTSPLQVEDSPLWKAMLTWPAIASDFKYSLLIEAFRCKDNIEATDHCVTRLRLTLGLTLAVDEAKIKSTGLLQHASSTKMEAAHGGNDVTLFVPWSHGDTVKHQH